MPSYNELPKAPYTRFIRDWMLKIAHADLQQKFQHAEYFNCNPLITEPIFIGFLGGFDH